MHLKILPKNAYTWIFSTNISCYLVNDDHVINGSIRFCLGPNVLDKETIDCQLNETSNDQTKDQHNTSPTLPINNFKRRISFLLANLHFETVSTQRPLVRI